MRKNPFKENIQVIDEGYIGRHEDINFLMNILGRNEKDGGVFVSGLTRMGKTSLVKKCFSMAEKEGLLKKNKIVTGCITISTVNDFSEFLRRMMDELYDSLEENDLLDSDLQELFEKSRYVLQNRDNDLIYELDRLLKRILKKMSKYGIKAVLLLDEFDDARRAFCFEGTEPSANFQKFRDYASEAKYNCTFVLTSRIDIKHIDASLPSGSNVRLVFSGRPLVGFTDEERNEFFSKIEECGVPLTPEQKKEYIWYAGRSPFLFSKIACRILSYDENVPCGDISIRNIVEKECKSDFYAYFDSLKSYMNRDRLFYKFIQVFLGPVYDLTKSDTDKLMEYGYIYHNQEDTSFLDCSYMDEQKEQGDGAFTYQTLSEFFVEYIRNRVSTDDSLKIWSELIDAEKTLRKLIQIGLQNKYGDNNWVDILQDLANSKERGYLYDVNKAEIFIADSKRNFGDTVEDNPLQVISINALGNIIRAFWDECYKGIFNPPYTELRILLDELMQLNKARNPLAHGLPDYLTPSEKEKVTQYCNKILHIPGVKKQKKGK